MPTDPDPLAGLVDAFERSHDPDPVVRADAAAALTPAALSSEAGPRLMTLLGDPDAQVAAVAAAGLARYGDAACLDAVAARVLEADAPARRAMVRAVADTAARYVFAAHRLVLLLDAGTGWPPDLDQAVRGTIAGTT